MSGGDAMKPANPGVKLTYDDFLLFPDDGQRHELIDGEHFVTPTPISRHQLIAGNIFFHVRAYLESRPIGTIIGFPLDVILSRHNVVEPDLLYVCNERRGEILKDWVRGAPDLVVEIASPRTKRRDETIKRDLYERFGVKEYWIVNPHAGAVRVYRADGGGFGSPVDFTLAAGARVTTPLMPGLELPLAAIFSD
jgi:Uma2 family endonuclease